MRIEWQKGDVVDDRWEIHQVLSGGMGIVCVAYDRLKREAVAAKSFREELFTHMPQFAERFRKEATTWIRLDAHQNVVKAHFFQHMRGRPFLFLEYVSGGDLSGYIRPPGSVNNLAQLLGFGIQFCDGMEYLAAKGIIAHRDIKPQNCLITEDGILKITDFGLVKAFDDQTVDVGSSSDRGQSRAPMPLEMGITRSGAVLGTPAYMAPEQYEDVKHADVRSDIYSFGVMLFQLITGHLPFLAQTWQEFQKLHAEACPPSLGSSMHDLDAVVQTCLAKEPTARFADFRDLRQALAGIYEARTARRAPQPAVGVSLNAYEYVNQGTSLAALGHIEPALACYERSKQINPGHFAVWFFEGHLLARIGRLAEAISAYERAIALKPPAEVTWLCWEAKGFSLARAGKTAEALAALDLAVQLNPSSWRAWLYKAEAWMNLGDGEQALECADRALRLRPESAEAWMARGSLFSRLKLKEKALANYDRALQLDPQCIDAWKKKGLALSDLGQRREALDCFKRALEIDPLAGELWANAAVQTLQIAMNPQAKTCEPNGLNEALRLFQRAQSLGYLQAAQGIAICQSIMNPQDSSGR